MKIPTAILQPNGQWRVRVKVDGKVQYLYGKTKRDAERQAAAIKSQASRRRTPTGITVKMAIQNYIDARSSKSPETIRGYYKIKNNRFQNIMETPIASITPKQWQTIVDNEGKKISEKYLVNSWSLVAGAVYEATGGRPEVNLPTVPEKDMRFLDREELPLFLKEIEGDPCEIQILLALHSLRKSEILDMTWNDIDLKKGLLHVRGAAVYNKDHELVHKETNKNETSRRTIRIFIPRLRELLEAAEPKKGYIHTGDPEKIYRHVKKACERAGITECSLHDLRRTFASLCYSIGVKELTCQKLGGWKDTATLHKVYVKLSEMDKSEEIDKLENFYQGNISGNKG